MAKGDIAYDEAAASTAAANIEALTKYDLPGLFIEGSESGKAEAAHSRTDDGDYFSFPAKRIGHPLSSRSLPSPYSEKRRAIKIAIMVMPAA